MNQEMTEVPDVVKVTNSPSQITQRECFQRGYKQGFDEGFKKGQENANETTNNNQAV